jgi:hypothetical protein
MERAGYKRRLYPAEVGACEAFVRAPVGQAKILERAVSQEI